VLQVDVVPAQPGRLAAPQAAQRDQVERRVQRVIGNRAEELRGLRRGRVCQIFCARDFSVSGSGCLSGLSQPRYLKFFCLVCRRAFPSRAYRALPGQMLRVLVFFPLPLKPGTVALPFPAA